MIVSINRPDSAASSIADGSPNLSALKILVVDDHREIRHMSSVLFSAVGHRVEVAATPHEALGIAEWFRPEVVLCDLRMPGQMDGCDLATALRSAGGEEASRLFAITGSHDESEHSRALQAGFDAVLQKPLDYGSIIETLGRAKSACGDADKNLPERVFI